MYKFKGFFLLRVSPQFYCANNNKKIKKKKALEPKFYIFLLLRATNSFKCAKKKCVDQFIPNQSCNVKWITLKR